MQCQPIDSASMNLEGLRRFHVGGVKRKCDPVLMAIQEGLRFIISNTAGGLFFARGYGGQEGQEPVDAILEARQFIEDAIPEEHHCSVYKVCEEIADGDVILAATRMCPHCGQSAIEKCTCMTARTLDEVNFTSSTKREQYTTRHTRKPGDGGDGGDEGEGGVDLGSLQAYSSVALEYARELRRTDGGDVE
ncbi:hypothetical protein T492DRAFT_880067 [Pavlovales sp. CCMP2436]|nr:hypothetical protein T492DRAFT_880067 [Pavlovales sp. CCMP2436]